MTTQQLIELSTDTWNNRDREGYLATYHEDCEITAPGFVGKGRQGVAEFWTVFMDAFPDNRVVLLHAIGNNSDLGAEESVFEGTHTGTLVAADGSEIPPTGKRVSLGFSGIHSTRGDMLASSHFYFDNLEFLTQLGVMTG
jgi:ketosteroid isomerase-like protein